MSSPTLSLIVPVLNEASGISARLSALAAWRDYAELIVVDGGSGDASESLARPLVDKLLVSEPGRARQLNAGAGIAGGDYLLFLHCDTTPSIAPATMLALLRERPAWGFFRVRLSGSDWRFRIIETFMNWRSRVTRVATGDQALFVSRELFEALGGYANIPLMEDVEICKRLRVQARPRVMDVPVVTSSRRWEQRGVVRTVLLMWLLRLRYWLGTDPARLARKYGRG